MNMQKAVSLLLIGIGITWVTGVAIAGFDVGILKAAKKASANNAAPNETAPLVNEESIDTEQTVASVAQRLILRQLSGSQFRVTWTHFINVNNVDKYYMDVSRYSNFRSFIPNYRNKDIGKVTSVEVSGLDKDQEYTFYVRIRVKDKNGRYSSYSRGSVRMREATAPVLNVSGGVPGRYVSLSWTKSIGAAWERDPNSSLRPPAYYVMPQQSIGINYPIWPIHNTDYTVDLSRAPRTTLYFSVGVARTPGGSSYPNPMPDTASNIVTFDNSN